MLLCLIPPSQLPTILFTLTFPRLPESLPIPPAWEAHLQLIENTHLAAPPCLLALDKSVAWTTLLDTVTFDLSTLTVTCTFIDGVHEEWPLTDRCLYLLEGVIRDVNRSAAEAENEHNQTRRDPDSHEEVPIPEPNPAPQKMPKPKKRRSFLASLVASIVPRLNPPPPPPPPPPAEELEILVTNGIPVSRFLRRRARSTLVDAFRRFVVSELNARFHAGEHITLVKTGLQSHLNDKIRPQAPHYALWAARSTMRRAAQEMASIIEYAMYASEARDELSRRDSKLEDGASQDDRDADDSGSASSTTDGSSVHTPLDFHDSPVLTSCPPTQCRPTLLTPQAYRTYVSLKDMHHRLHDLSCQLSAHAAAQEQTAAAEMCGAEIRSKRRAWSMKQYLTRTTGGVLGGANVGLVGLAVPVRSSPLVRGWSAEDSEKAGKAKDVGSRTRERDTKWVHNDVRRSKSVDMGGELTQRGRYTSVLGKSHEAEDIDTFRPRIVSSKQGSQDSNARLDLDIDGDHSYGYDHDTSANREDDGIYEKRSEDEFVLPHAIIGKELETDSLATMHLGPYVASKASQQLRIAPKAARRTSLTSHRLYPTVALALEECNSISAKFTDTILIEPELPI